MQAGGGVVGPQLPEAWTETCTGVAVKVFPPTTTESVTVLVPLEL